MTLSDSEIREVVFPALESEVAGERILILVPDHTRVLPLEQVRPALVEALHRASSLEVMVALGTHPPDAVKHVHWLTSLAASTGRRVAVRNHEWRNEEELTSLGVIEAETIQRIAGKVWHRSLDAPLEVRINRAVVGADRIIVVGPTLPHEVAGFSGGMKYLFPGIGGPEMIDVMHWLGALSGVMAGRRPWICRANSTSPGSISRTGGWCPDRCPYTTSCGRRPGSHRIATLSG